VHFNNFQALLNHREMPALVFNYRSTQLFKVLLFCREHVMHYFDKNVFGYIFGDYFSQTHLVTLLSWDVCVTQNLVSVPVSNGCR
jgi:hypothetical protein